MMAERPQPSPAQGGFVRSFRNIRCAAATAVLVAVGSIGGASAATTVHEVTHPKLTAALSLSPRSTYPGQLVTAKIGKSTVPKGTAVKKITLSWGDHSKVVTVSSLKAKPTHRYSRAGHYTVTVAVTDATKHTAKATATASIAALTNPPTSTPSSKTLHYTANGVFNGSTYSPGAYGFDLVDVESTWWATHLPAGTKALVWLGLCTGANAAFTSTVTPYLSNPGVLGYYLYDEPDPTGKWKTPCTAANLKAESDWIHAHDPGKKTFLMLMNLASSSEPTYQGTYNPANTGIDLYGLDPYPCRSELNGCNYTYITKRVAAAEAWGIPQSALVPVFQTFGGGAWVDDGDGSYALPTASQEKQILATWASVLPHPVFDYAYSWGTQHGDVALGTSPALLSVIAQHNATS